MSKPVFVPFPEPKLIATFLRRRNRFVAEMRLKNNRLVLAHCSNTGSMKACLAPEVPAVIWRSPNRERKLPYSWKAIKIGRIWIGVDTMVPNRLVELALKGGRIPGLRGYERVLRERPMGDRSRVDVLLEGERGRCFVEVKNVTLVEERVARFPDAVTTRGLKHLTELQQRVAEGDRAAMVYVVQRSDGQIFEPASDIDPTYAEGLREAHGNGVEVYVLSTRVSPRGVTLVRQLPWRLS